MADFFPLEVINIKQETRDSVVLTLKPSAVDQEKFSYIQGQYLSFKKEFDGEELRRSYSICSSLDDETLRVGIKKVNGGWFSTWANEELKVGDILNAMPPNGKFFGSIEPEKSKNYIIFAIGSGITPILSIIKTILENEPKAKVILVYGNRSFNTIMFKEELNDLKDQYMSRLSLLHVLKHDAGDIDLLNGRINAEKCDQFFTRWMSPKVADMAFICGPQEMMLMVSERLQAHGMSADKIKFELFAGAPPKKSRAKDVLDSSKKDVKATVIIDGVARSFLMHRNSESILEAALAEKIEVPFSCQAGVCSTCSAKVTKGKVEMQANYALEDYEVDHGLTLTCQAYPLTDEVVVDYDQH